MPEPQSQGQPCFATAVLCRKELAESPEEESESSSSISIMEHVFSNEEWLSSFGAQVAAKNAPSQGLPVPVHTRPLLTRVAPGSAGSGVCRVLARRF